MQGQFSQNEPMKEMYLLEAATLLERLNEILLKSETNEDYFKQHINELFRIAHTLKGSSAMMDYDNLSKFTHKLEDLIYDIKEKECKKMPGLFDLLLYSSDYINKELHNIRNNIIVEHDPVPIEKLEDFINRTFKDKEGKDSPHKNQKLPRIPIPDIPIPGSLQYEEEETNDKTHDEETHAEDIITPELISHLVNNILQGPAQYNMHVYFNKDAGMENVRAYMLMESLSEIGLIVSYYPKNLKNNKDAAEEIIEDGFYICIESDLSRKELEQITKKNLSLESLTFMKTMPYCEDRDEKKSTTANSIVSNIEKKQDKPYIHNNVGSVKPIDSKYMHINSEKIDDMVDLIGELSYTESLIIGNPHVGKIDDHEFERTKRSMINQTSELRDTLLSMRLVPIYNVFNRIRRVVRDMNRALDKDVEFIVLGEDTEIDSTILDSLIDPLIHIVRNSMDHGIESAEERASKGKNTKGQILLSAKNIANEILIQISDDGRGIDKREIIKRAHQLGILDTDKTKQDDIFSIISTQGFTMQENINEYSGRGVGLDIVSTEIRKINGSISFKSVLGKGTDIIIKIPLTMAIMTCIQAVAENETYSIPIMDIEESFILGKNAYIHGKQVVYKGQSYKYHRLADIIEKNTYKHHNIDSELKDGFFILLKKEFCIFVDKIHGKTDIVIKPLPNYIKYLTGENVPIFSGYTITDSDKVSLIINTDQLLSG